MKKIHIHLGPHKTGSTAIQEYLNASADYLSENYQIEVIRTKLIADIGQKMTHRNYKCAHKLASLIADSCRDDAASNFLVSSEDFSGDLPGRSNARHPYRELWRNIKVFETEFSDFERHYYFFIRDKEDWLKSAYIQSIKHRVKFKSYQDFCNFLEHDSLWTEVVSKSKKMLGDRMHLIAFENCEASSSIEQFCLSTNLLLTEEWPPIEKRLANTSPEESTVNLLELINQARCSQTAVLNAKQFILRYDSVTPRKSSVVGNLSATSEKKKACCNDVPPELKALWERSQTQIHTQDQPDILPDPEVGWSLFGHSIVEYPDAFPTCGRQKIENQREILRYRFRGMPEICYLVGLSISYLRRDTPHTCKASALFQRLWSEEYPLLLAILPTRWLISSFQTFAEHGIDQEQKLIGTAGFTFGNLMKIYEGERSLEGLSTRAVYSNTQPETEASLHGMDRYNLGGTDLLVNTLSHLVELSTREKIAGRVMQEFLSRVREDCTVFSRHDKSKIHHEIDIPQFSNCWSFFEHPER
jgi:hypothetical protein